MKGVEFVALVSVAALLMAMLTVLAPFDFRGDVDQIALLKTLPAPAWRIARGRFSRRRWFSR